MGGPSAAIVFEELIALGVRRAVRVGTAGGLDPGLALGALVVATEALAADGTSRTLGGGERIAGDPGLIDALHAGAPQATLGPIVSSDLFYEVGTPRFARWREAGAIAVEMETATLFALGRLRGVSVGCVLAITDLLAESRERIDEAALLKAGLAAGRAGIAALG
jgi:uridine phosphorylase